MYIGSTGTRGLHHLIYEVMDNSVDEALAGEADHVDIAIHPDNGVSVTDNGGGIPVDMHEKEGRPAAEVVLTVLHAGGKFGDGGGYKVSGGFHGVGVSVVNALAERLDLTVWRDGYEWTQFYERGKPLGELQKGPQTDRRGTSITFLPDLEIFETIDYERAVLEQRFREMAFLKEKEDNLQGEDVREGLTAIISVKLQEPQFEGQTKTKLGNPPVEGFVQAAVNRSLAEFLEENPSDAKQIITKAVQAARAREAARKARDLTRKSALENSN